MIYRFTLISDEAEGFLREIQIDPEATFYDFHEAIIKSVKKTGTLMAVESGFPSFGVASEILALACEYGFDYLQAPPVRVTVGALE